MMVGFMATRAGRWTRILTGAGMILGGLAFESPRGNLVALIGFAPLLAGIYDVCLLGPLFGLPFQGGEVRRQLGLHEEASLLPEEPVAEREPRPVLLH